MSESNIFVSAYTTYRHLQQYCSHPSIYSLKSLLCDHFATLFKKKKKETFFVHESYITFESMRMTYFVSIALGTFNCLLMFYSIWADFIPLSEITLNSILVMALLRFAIYPIT